MKSRNTKQKILLSDMSSSMTGFFTAEDLLAKVKKSNKNIGIATIYRFLNERVSAGALHSYICNRKSLYSNSSNNHSHYTCEKCGKVTHIEIKNIDFLKKNIPGDVCHFQIDVHGMCDGCSKKNK